MRTSLPTFRSEYTVKDLYLVMVHSVVIQGSVIEGLRGCVLATWNRQRTERPAACQQRIVRARRLPCNHPLTLSLKAWYRAIPTGRFRTSIA